MDILTLLAIAVAPGLAIALYVYWQDKFDREPKKILVMSFFLGMVAILPAFFIELSGNGLMSEGSSLISVAVYAFVVVGGSEEFCKFVMLRLYAYRKKAFNEPFDGITYGVMVSMGFATLENIMYVFQYGAGNGIVRMFTAVPAHATFGIVMGYYVGLAKFGKQEAKYLATGFLYAALLHGAYDFFLMQQFIPGITFGALVSLYIGIRFSRKAIRMHQDQSPFRQTVIHDNENSGPALH